MKRSVRALLVALLFALPLQGAMAATRLCMAMGSGGGSHSTASTASGGHGDAQYAPVRGHGHHGEHGSTSGHGDLADADAGHGEHAAGTCKLCSACCLTVAVAPPGPSVFPGDATGGLFRPIDVAVPPAIAGGLERPPRTT